MATSPAPSPSAGPVLQPAQEAKQPRLTALQTACLELLSDGRVRKATTKTSPTTDEVNGTTAGSMVPYGYVEARVVPGHTMYAITPKGLEALRSLDDKKQMLAAKKTEAKPATEKTVSGQPA